jgi:ketosteroid isomerase-like protein
VSAENLEIIRRLYALWQGDRAGTGPLPLLADDFEYVNPPYAVHTGTRHGKDGWTAATASLDDSFESWSHVPGEMIDAGDKVLVIATFRARGRGSSVELEKFEPQVWTLRDGAVIRLQWFNDRDEALRAAGLSE